MNRAEQKAYDRDYAAAKKDGKPFFPYAMYKDTIVAGAVIAIVIILAIMARVQIGEPVNPATTDFIPRPEWYFYFLFELLRIFKGQDAFTPVIMATVIVPNVLLILLVAWPFIDRGAERRIWKRPISLALSVLVVGSMAYLTFLGATAPEGISAGATIPVSNLDAAGEAGAKLFIANGCGSCHMIKGVGAPGPGPDLTNEGAKGKDQAWMINWLKKPIAPMPSFASLPPKDLADLADFMNGLGTKYK